MYSVSCCSRIYTLDTPIFLWIHWLAQGRNEIVMVDPLNIQPIVIVRGIKRQQAVALTNFVGCFLLALLFLFSLLLFALNDLTGPSAGPLAQITYSIPFCNGRHLHHFHLGPLVNSRKKPDTFVLPPEALFIIYLSDQMA